MITLALDTCLSACSAAVLRDGDLLCSRVEVMARGHQERLAGLVSRRSWRRPLLNSGILAASP